jgi:hypothetical protein
MPLAYGPVQRPHVAGRKSSFGKPAAKGEAYRATSDGRAKSESESWIGLTRGYDLGMQRPLGKLPHAGHRSGRTGSQISSFLGLGRHLDNHGDAHTKANQSKCN